MDAAIGAIAVSLQPFSIALKALKLLVLPLLKRLYTFPLLIYCGAVAAAAPRQDSRDRDQKSH